MSDEILDSLNAIVESGRRLVIVYPVPEMGWDVPKYLARYLLNGNDLEMMSGSVSYDSFLARNKNAISVLDKVGISLNVVRVYPHEELCSKTLNFCAAHRDGDLLYFDDDHVSNFGARIISQKIISIFGKTRN